MYEFVPFANTFERGDIVRDCRNGKIGVVETSREKWNDRFRAYARGNTACYFYEHIPGMARGADI